MPKDTSKDTEWVEEERDVERMLVGFLRALLDESLETNN